MTRPVHHKDERESEIENKMKAGGAASKSGPAGKTSDPAKASDPAQATDPATAPASADPATDPASAEPAADSASAEPVADGAPPNEELQTQFVRLAADFQNFRRRVDKEKSEVFAYANEKIMTELLPVIDNFERALEVGSTDIGYADGMSLIYKQFLETLRKNGLTEVKAAGETFDPDFHHAVLMEQNTGAVSGQVTGVMQKGYLLNNKVIRPAMVKVAE